ncbi:hypothetical protein BH20ACT7_BH20ACT7_06570 [soil metagenome]
MADLNQRLSDLEETLALATDRLDPDTVAAGQEVLDKVEGRLANGPGSVVVALAGGTGSGKSSLFNALAGAELTRTGVIRPVTDEVTAWAVGDPQGAANVLDWLQVRRRHQVAPSRLYPEGLVLLDLPDHDSVSAEHRLLVDRFVARVDVLVWVVDPLKYAQRSLHADYLRRLAAHAKVLVVVLNRIDELGNEAAGIVADDLRQLLAAEGLGRAKLLVTSARTGVGLDRLRATLTDYVNQRRAMTERISADLQTLAGKLRAQVGDTQSTTLQLDRLVSALSAASGVESLADAGARTYTEDADDASRPLLTGKVLGRLRSLRTPLRRLRRPAPPSRELSPVGVRHAVLELADTAASDLPHPWPFRLRTAAHSMASDLPGVIAGKLDLVDVHGVRKRLWWSLLRVLGTVIELAALVGVIWLLLLGLIGWLQLPEPPTPAVGRLPWPTLLAVGGGIGLLIFAAVRRRLVGMGARRHRWRVLHDLRGAVAEVARERALVPLQAEVDAHNRLVETLSSVEGAGQPRGRLRR